ncbi:S-adenosyl-L-methionine-dependent methyltransferase [Morchella conica CCBAS932]|uniref:S-adenosyl-L-methionine-dependent methyltransferase n=1 Tax=Morchella conica CCBAS932 TaxID=1392247 RepID=A0A3N4KNG1_9PEZI|nr:S-adenosyl-L-methionine-dependent methyltransferase [Morchella conica CCBAS932]
MSGYDSDTTSLSSTVKGHVYENGRRYHGWHEGRYAMPNDEEEQDRMDLQHHICLLALKGRLHNSPHLENPQKILDLGTGNGIWAIDCGDLYPDAEIVGVDFSPIQPRWVPPNVTFEVDDVEQTWTYPDNTFDMVHIRQLIGFIDDWPKIYAQAMRVLKPGGILEISDFFAFGSDDNTLPDDSTIMKWCRMWIDGISKAGRQLPTSDHSKQMAKVGFEGIQYEQIKIALGTWPKNKAQKDLGFYMRQHMIDGCDSISLAVFTRFLGMDKDDVKKLNNQFRKDLLNRSYHSYTNFYVTYGRKPLVPAVDATAAPPAADIS